jgi:hypothetical protein
MQERLRRRRTAPSDLVVLYAAMLFQHKFHPSHPTVEASILLAQGLGKSLGMRDSDVRDSLVRIHQDPDLGKFLSYSQAANLDSVQFSMSGTPALTKIRSYAYQSGSIQWP